MTARVFLGTTGWITEAVNCLTKPAGNLSGTEVQFGFPFWVLGLVCFWFALKHPVPKQTKQNPNMRRTQIYMYLFPRSPQSGRVVWVVSCAFDVKLSNGGLNFHWWQWMSVQVFWKMIQRNFDRGHLLLGDHWVFFMLCLGRRRWPPAFLSDATMFMLPV